MSTTNDVPKTASCGVANPGSNIVLTYNNTKETDGAGAQLQRIYGIYSISRLLGASYLHSPLRRVNNQGLSALERNTADPYYHECFNELLQIKSDVLETDDFHEIDMKNISMEEVDQLISRFENGETDGKPILVRLEVPYGIADQFPDCYEVCKDISPFPPPVRDGRPLRVAIHVRRGELFAVESHRMLPNAYYVNVARNLEQILEALGIGYQLEIHTEIATSEFVVQPGGYPGIPRNIAPTVVTPAMSHLEEFSALPNLVYCLNEPATDCLCKLATADILVMSRSSFSYVAAILNKAGVILYHPFWHSAPSPWLTVAPDGQFDRSRFDETFKRLIPGTSAPRSGIAHDDRPGKVLDDTDQYSSLIELPPNQYLAVGAEPSANQICVVGWRARENWGAWAEEPRASLRFGTEAPTGTIIHLILQLVAPDDIPRRICVSSGSGASTEAAIAGSSDQLVVLSCTVEPGHLISVRISLAETAGAPEDVGPPYWGLKGLLLLLPGVL
jgi:hypothetical protein